MLRMDYHKSDLSGWEVRQDPASATKSELSWYYFPGDIEISDGTATIRTSFGWVPAIHFVASHILIAQRLAEGVRDCRYYFTESDDWIRYRRADDLFEITSSFSSEVVHASLDEFASEARTFAAKTVMSLVRRYPPLFENPVITEILAW